LIPLVFGPSNVAAGIRVPCHIRCTGNCGSIAYRASRDLLAMNRRKLSLRVAMLEIKFIRENRNVVADGARKKHMKVDLDRLLELDEERRKLQLSIDNKRAQQNTASRAIANARDTERKDAIGRMQRLKETLKHEEDSLQEIMKEWRALMMTVPNVPDSSVPEGQSDADNKEVRRWGDIPKFDFEPKSHTELMLTHDMADFERGAKVTGFRGYFLKNDGARLVWALERFVQDRFMRRSDFVPMVAPSLVRRGPFVGTGYLPQSEEDSTRRRMVIIWQVPPKSARWPTTWTKSWTKRFCR
jgi:seryl-tRNA synthetase